MDISGIGGLAYQIFIDLQNKKTEASTEEEQVNRYLRAIILELRVVVNLVDLSLRADEANDATGRNNILRQIECPLLGAIGMGLSGVPITSDGAKSILDGFSSPSAETTEVPVIDESADDRPDRDIVDLISLIVSRIYTVQALANAEPLEMGINWTSRLKRLRTELILLLKSLLEKPSNQT